MQKNVMGALIMYFITANVVALGAIASDGDFAWAKGMGGTHTDIGRDVTVDGAGNVYVTGVFQQTVDFDPGAGVYELTSPVGFSMFVLKLDSAGEFVWAKMVGGTGNPDVQGIAVDNEGNVAVVGTFGYPMDFDPGEGYFELGGMGGLDVFILKLDTFGDFVWAKSLGGPQNDTGNGVAIDSEGSVYTTGYFTDTADFDPGPDAFELYAPFLPNTFISKLNGAGNFVWAYQLAGDDSFSTGEAIAVDGMNNVYATGIFHGTTDFNPGMEPFELVSTGGYDIFVTKRDSNGNFVWAGAISGTSDKFVQDIDVDTEGSVLTAGYFAGTADFDPGPDSYDITATSISNVFVTKFSSMGNLVWAKAMGGDALAEAYGVTVDVAGSVYTTGRFNGTVDFDPNEGIFNLTAPGGTKVFVSKLDPRGNCVWAKDMGGDAYSQGEAVATDNRGNVYATGYFVGTVDFDPGLGVFEMTSAGGYDIFLVKLSGPPPPGVVLISRMHPTPTEGGTLGFRVIFDTNVTGVNVSDFVLNKTGSISGGEITSVVGFGREYTVIVSNVSGDGTLRLDLIDHDSIMDAYSVPLGDPGIGNGNYTAGEVYIILPPMPLFLWPVALMLTAAGASVLYRKRR